MVKKQELAARPGILKLTTFCLSIFLLAVWPSISHALEFDLGNDTTLVWDTTLTYSLAMRVEDQKAELLSNINSDDGNRNFDDGSLIQNQFRVLSEADLRYKNIGAFIRGRGFYDFVYNGSNDNDSPGTLNNSASFGGDLEETDEFSEKTIDRHGDDIELLDLFAYGTFKVGSSYLDLRAGRQVVSWGESLVTPYSVSTAQAPLDLSAFNIPGVELKDVFLPTGQVYGKVDLPSNFSFAAYYQWEWEANRFDEAGSYYSTFDYLDEAGQRILLRPGLNATVDRTQDQDASDDGQFGFAARYLAESLNDTEFGIYYLNYHEKMPMVIDQFGTGGVPSPINAALPFPVNVLDVSSYYLRYPEDISLYAISAGTVIADINFGAEVSYRSDYPVRVVSTSPRSIFGFTYEEADVLQVILNSIYIFGPSFIADNTVLTVETGLNEVYDEEARLYYDSFAWGFTAKLAFDYYNIAQGLDLNVPITYKGNIAGNSSLLGSYIEGKDSINMILGFTYRKDWKLDLGYTMFIGDVQENNLTDRDNVSLAVKYKF